MKKIETTTNQINSKQIRFQSKSTLKAACDKMIIVSYFLGLFWILLHPIVSITTGELKCRGLFIDENSLLYGNFETTTYSNSNPRILRKDFMKSIKNDKRTGICSMLKFSRLESQCIQNEMFDVVKIIPPSSVIQPSEAIAVIVSPPYADLDVMDWTGSDFHESILILIDRLSDPIQSAWLSKTIFIVSPMITDLDENNKEFELNRDKLMEKTSVSFLKAYLGGNFDSERYPIQILPPSFTSPLLRNVIVTDVQRKNKNNTSSLPLDIKILPQGRKGALPNLDLVSAVVETFIPLKRSKTATLSFHPYQNKLENAIIYISSTFPIKSLSRKYVALFEEYSAKLGGMIAFASSLAFERSPPHAPFLSHGIDSLTIQIVLSDSSKVSFSSTITPQIETIIRMLSNLHERLHHSVTQYLLPSSTTFVSNGEYTFSVILLLVPLLIRAIYFIALPKHMLGFKFQWKIVITVAILSLSCVSLPLFLINICVSFWNAGSFGMRVSTGIHNGIDTTYLRIMNTSYILLYSISLISTIRFALKSSFQNRAIKYAGSSIEKSILSLKSIQCFSVLITLYIHVPIALAHVSLAIPSTLFWSPIFSFPSFDYYSKYQQIGNNPQRSYWGFFLKRIASFALWALSWPPMGLMNWLDGTCTLYLLWVYTPLHFLFGIIIFFDASIENRCLKDNS